VGQLAGAISFLGFVPYIIEIAQGKTRPNRATWWIWAVVGAMLCASSYASGALAKTRQPQGDGMPEGV
jgi:hypothetical protein